MSKVSLIVPVYNVEKYLDECLSSIVNQTLRDIEIICVNDGSTDASLSIIKKYASIDNRIKVIDKLNTGYGHSMNCGLKKATGEYVGIVESDDFADPNMFEELYDAAISNVAEVVKSNYYEYAEKNKIYIENLLGLGYNVIYKPIEKPKTFFVAASIWSGLYKRSFLFGNSIYFNETPGASYQDTSFSFKVFSCATRLLLVKNAYLNYRINNMDSSVNSGTKVFCICDEFTEIRRFLSNRVNDKIKMSGIQFALKFKDYMWNYNRLASAYQYAFLLRITEEFNDDQINGCLNTELLNETEKLDLLEILNNINGFFIRTAKDYRDSRLANCATLNNRIYYSALVECIKAFRNVIIYGAGGYGKRIAEKLMKLEERPNLLCFAVSEIKNNPKQIEGINVVSIYELCAYRSNSIVVVATKEQYQYDIISTLKSLDFENIVSLDEKLINAIRKYNGF
jgi:Glycosyltransferases involved in cell wall biogenesis